MDNKSGKYSEVTQKNFVQPESESRGLAKFAFCGFVDFFPFAKLIIAHFPDPRVNDWFLMSSPFPTLFMCLFYAYFVKVLGPKLMENRKPFQLKGLILGYNLAQVIFSTWLFYEVKSSIFLSSIYFNSGFVSELRGRLDDPLQLQVPTSGLFQKSSSIEGNLFCYLLHHHQSIT